MIESLPQRVASLPERLREVFDRIFEVHTGEGILLPNRTLIKKYGVDVDHQKLVVVRNKVVGQQTIFNVWRAKRPKPKAPASKKSLKKTHDVFADPLVHTPEDVFGRIRGKFSLTGSNLAKYAPWHGLVVFRHHNALRLQPKELADGYRVAQQWFAKVQERDPSVRHRAILWNANFKAGATIEHVHWQLIASPHPWEKVARLTNSIISYEERYRSLYLADFFAACQKLGLGATIGGLHVVSSLTPLKEREVMCFTSNLKTQHFTVLGTLLRKLVRAGTESFNMFISLPPPDADQHSSTTPNETKLHTGRASSGRGKREAVRMPALIWFVDRGSLKELNCDLGAMELYAASVVASDPFEVAKILFSR